MSILNVNKINPVGSGSTITIAGIASVTNNISVGNSVTASEFHGSGSNLTGVPSVANQADNRLITCTGTTDSLNAESNLTFSSNQLTVHEAKLKGNQLLFTTSGTAYLDHSTVGQDIQVRVSTSSSNDTTGPTFKSNGNLAFAAGKGIDFSAQSASSESGASTDAELLNHYEQGTWTPQMWRINHGSEITIGSGNRSGRYIRVGNLLHISFYWYNPSLSSSSGTIWVLRSLPFNIHTGSPSQSVMGGYYYFANGNSQPDSHSGAGAYRWQANANFSSNTLTLYGHDRDQNGNGAVEFSGTGTLSIP